MVFVTEGERYTVLVQCENCKHEMYHTLVKGTSVRWALADEVCIKCGCELIQKKREKMF